MRKIKRNDMVKVIAGKEKGKIAKVLKVVDKGNRVILEKLNIVKKHTKPSKESQFGGIIEKEAPIHISNVMLLSSQENPTRVSFKYLDTPDGKKKKVRYSRKYNEILD